MRVHRLDIESVTVESFPVAPLGSPDFSTYAIANRVDTADPWGGAEDGYASSPGLTCGASCGCP